jgi:hypothetical protein
MEQQDKAAAAPSGSGYAFEQNFPTPAAAQQARDDAEFQRAVTVYRFWYPAISTEGFFNGFVQSGGVVNKMAPILMATPVTLAYTANSDTPYGATGADLSLSGPLVVELPPGPFIALADDHYQRWIADMGLPGPDGGKGGKHLIIPPGYKGAVPAGYYASRSASNMVLVAIRSIPQNGDAAAALEALKRIKIYPLSTAKAPQPFTFVNMTDKAVDLTPLKWEDNFEFWKRLKGVIDQEPMVPEWEPMYGELLALGIAKGKPFTPDARMTAILEHAARAGRDQMMVAAFGSVRPERMAWKDRRWEWVSLIDDNGDFMTPAGPDLRARDRWFIQATLMSPAMVRRTTNAGSLYWQGYRDSSGAMLDGGKTYKLTVPLPVPSRLFWSVTAYDAATRSEIVTAQNKAALRSLFELKDLGDAKSVDLYFGPKAPTGQEGRWIQTTPGRGWFTYFRIYGPDKGAFDGSWMPGDFVEVK